MQGLHLTKAAQGWHDDFLVEDMRASFIALVVVSLATTTQALANSGWAPSNSAVRYRCDSEDQWCRANNCLVYMPQGNYGGRYCLKYKK